jgi:ABC-type bacteriocin/lantibiotic exporter with double-glycine peptidase domain
MVKKLTMTKKKLISREDTKLLRRSLSYVKQYKFKFFLLLFSIITIIILGIFQPLLWGNILEDITKGDYNDIRINLLSLLLIYIFQAIITLIRGYLEALLNNSIIYDLKSEMYLKILNLSMNVLDKMKTGEFISRLQGDVFTLANIITNQLVTAIVNILKVIILGVTIFKINFILSLIVLASFPLSFILFLTFGKKLRTENKEISKINDRYFSFLQQSLLGIKHIKTYGIKKSNYKKFNELSMDYKNKQSRIALIQILSQSLSMVLNSLSDVILIGVSIYFILSGELSVQYFVAFLAYSGQFSQSLTSLTQLNSNIQQVLVSLERIFGLLDNLQFSNEVFGDKNVRNIKGEIEFKDIFFSYNEEKEILKGTSFKANQEN